jgi:cytochrome c-type biogenesis protein CcmH
MDRPKVTDPMKQWTDDRLARRAAWALLAGLLLALALAGVVAAQSDTPPATVAPGVTANDVNEVARRLYCPLCSGVRLDACELKACIQMKEVIALKLSEGESFEQIRDYFVEQYGPQVLGEPPRQGFSLLAWTLPVIVLVLAGVFFWRKASALVRRPAAQPSIPPTPATGEDEYERKLEEELAKYG